jgi:hypothetical protein
MIPCTRWLARLPGLAVLALAPQLAQAQTCPLSVDASGAGHFTSIQAAVNHFKSALGNLGPCTIEVRAGVYTTAATLDAVNAGATSEADRLVIRGTRGSAGEYLTRLSTGSSTALTLRRSAFVSLEDFEVTTQTNKPFTLDAGSKKNRSVVIARNDFHDNGDGRDAGCIWVGDGNQSTWIVNNACWRNGGNAIVLGVVSPTNFVLNNTILGHGKSGIVVAKGANVTLANNLVLFNGSGGGAQFGIQLLTGKGAQGDRKLLHNVVYGNDVGVGGDFAGRSTATSDDGNQDTAKLGAGLLANDFLVDPAAGNLRLTAGSPALNAGLAPTASVPVPDEDFEKGPRNDVAPDVGWDEITDADFDGQPDSADNCPPGLNRAYNPDQGDADEDGVGNYCDNCPDVANPEQTDVTGFDAFGNATGVANGRGDACENASEGVGESLFQPPTGPPEGAVFVASFGVLGETRTIPPTCECNTYFYCDDAQGNPLPRSHFSCSRGIPDDLVTFPAGTQVTLACPLAELFPPAAFGSGTFTCKACYDNEHQDLDLQPNGSCAHPPCEENFTGLVCSAPQTFTVGSTAYGGCSPNFWTFTNDPQPWLDAGFDGTEDFDTTFGVDRFDSDVTLFGALFQTGEIVDGLAREAVAGLLNASNPNVHYPYLPAAVKALLKQNDPDGRLTDANALDCPIEPASEG